eukprot:5252383-Pyramimonas_sp.AAC.1
MSTLHGLKRPNFMVGFTKAGSTYRGLTILNVRSILVLVGYNGPSKERVYFTVLTARKIHAHPFLHAKSVRKETSKPTLFNALHHYAHIIHAYLRNMAMWVCCCYTPAVVGALAGGVLAEGDEARLRERTHQLALRVKRVRPAGMRDICGAFAGCFGKFREFFLDFFGDSSGSREVKGKSKRNFKERGDFSGEIRTR